MEQILEVRVNQLKYMHARLLGSGKDCHVVKSLSWDGFFLVKATPGSSGHAS